MATASKPAKPYADFPLFAHHNGQWAKKIKGKVYYFGTEANAALSKYLEQRDDLHAGRTPRPKNALTVAALCSRFREAKEILAATGDISNRMLLDYVAHCDWLVKLWGDRVVSEIRPSDFQELRAKLPGKSPHTIGNSIQRIRSIFRYAGPDGMDLIPRAVQFGPMFSKPGARVMRRHRQQQGAKMFSADELRRALATADTQLTAMMLLGLNCGFGNIDCASLPKSAIALEAGWIDFPRPKTGIERRCPLWPETIAALRTAIATRPHHRDARNADLVFLTKHGERWLEPDEERQTDPIGQKFRRLMIRLKMYQPGRNFYTLRRVFETMAGKDQVAIDLIMGHVTEGQGTTYRQGVEDTRLQAAANNVRTWLIGDGIQTLEQPLTPTQAARYLGVPTTAVYYWVQSKKLASIKTGERIRIPLAACEQLRVIRNTSGYSSAASAGPEMVAAQPIAAG